MSFAWSVSASAEEPPSEEGVGPALGAGAEEVEEEGRGWCGILLLTPGRRSGPGCRAELGERDQSWW